MSKLTVIEESEWKYLERVSQRVAQVPTFSFFKKPFEAWLAIKAGHELGITEIDSLNNIYVINGRTACSGQLMLRKIRQAGHMVQIDCMSSTLAKVFAKRKDESVDPIMFSFSMEEAKLAGITNKDNWKKYPSDMLMWRCVARMARFMFPDCIGPASHIPDELGFDEERSVTSFVPPEVDRSDLTDVFTDKPECPPQADTQGAEAPA